MNIDVAVTIGGEAGRGDLLFTIHVSPEDQYFLN